MAYRQKEWIVRWWISETEIPMESAVISEAAARSLYGVLRAHIDEDMPLVRLLSRAVTAWALEGSSGPKEPS